MRYKKQDLDRLIIIVNKEVEAYYPDYASNQLRLDVWERKYKLVRIFENSATLPILDLPWSNAHDLFSHLWAYYQGLQWARTHAIERSK